MTKNLYFAKPKFTMTGFNKGNLYEIDPESLEDGKPKFNTLNLKNSKKDWVKMPVKDFDISGCLFNENNTHGE